jgi:hypothetical protein
VEGAIVVGRSPSEAAMGASTTPSPQPQVRGIPTRENAEPQDLTGVGREVVLKWAVPMLASAVALAVVVWLIRRR